MESSDKIFISLIIAALLLLASMIGASIFSDALKHDCRLAAMSTRLYDSAHIAQICGK